MNKEFVTYEQALALKELGFDEPCFGTYDEDKNFELQDFEQRYDTFPSHIIAAPLKQQVFRWFRENHGLDYSISFAGREGEYHAFVKDYVYGNNGSSPSVFSYEEAEDVCIDKLIEIIKSIKTQNNE